MPNMRGMIVLAVACIAATPAHADVVSDWNAITLQYVAGDPTAAIPAGRAGVPPSTLDVALVQAAVHDAVQTIEGRFEPYFYADASLKGVGSPAAAVAAAAHRMLVLLYPTQQASLDALFEDYLATKGLVEDPGLAIGEAAAIVLYTTQYRPPIPLPDFFGRDEIGEWRSTSPMSFLFLAFSEPFTLRRISQFRPPPPPPLKSARYAREYDEVKALGNAAAHPNAQTDLALFWSGNFVAQYNEAMRQIANAQLLDVGDSARLFALANLAMADSVMAVWHSKYFYNFWRPQAAIQQGDNDRNAKTVGDVTWTSLIATPSYSDYVSGANGLTGAVMGVLKGFFGTDEVNFSVKNLNPQVSTQERFYTSFSEVSDEIVFVRILQGIHFRSAEEEGRRLGERVGQWVFRRFLRPVRGTK